MASSVPQWESCKENAAPIRRGRRVESLEHSFSCQQNDDTRILNEIKIREFERLVQTSETDGFEMPETGEDADPLKYWVKYIQFYQDTNPSDTANQLILLERCFRAMNKVQKYKNDERFIKICCVFADKSRRPHDIFKYCHEQGIGIEVAFFWIAWAFVAEKEGNFPFAEKVFDKGIRKNAKPLKLLQQRLKHFQRRMSRHWLNSTQIDEMEDERGSDIVVARGVLGTLDQASVARNDRSNSAIVNRSRSRHHQALPPRNSTTKLPFPVFVDENAVNGENLLDESFTAPSDHRFQREEDLLKENIQIASRWNEHGALSNTSLYSQRAKLAATRHTTPLAFNVYVDSECSARHQKEEKEKLNKEGEHRRMRDERTFQERQDTSATEKLTMDPLRYVKNPSKLEKDYIAEERYKEKLQQKIQSTKNSGATKSKGNGGLIPICKHFPDQSFEEVRANASFFKILSTKGNINSFVHSHALHQNFMGDESMTLSQEIIDRRHSETLISDSTQSHGCNSDVYDVTATAKVRSSFQKQGHLSNILFPDDKVDQFAEPTPRNTSTASSTINEAFAVGIQGAQEEQTINTAFAQKEISMMFFGSPALSVNKTRIDIDRSHECSLTPQCDDKLSRVHSAEFLPHIEGENVSSINMSTIEDTIGRVARASTSNGFQIYEDSISNTDIDHPERARLDKQQMHQNNSSNFLADDTVGQLECVPISDGFQIYEDFTSNTDTVNPDGARLDQQQNFHIYEELEQFDQSSCSAILLESDDIQRGCNHTNASQTPERYEERKTLTQPFTKKLKTEEFSIYVDTNVVSHENKLTDGDTATFSVFNGFSVESPSPRVQETLNCDDIKISTLQLKKLCVTSVSEDENDTASWSVLDEAFNEANLSSSAIKVNSTISIHDNSSLETTMFTTYHHDAEPLDYTKVHLDNLNISLEFAQNHSCSCLPKGKSLFSTFSVSGRIYDLKKHVLPRLLKQSIVPDGTCVKISTCSGKVKRQIGRGKHGIVAILDNEKNCNSHIVIKTRSPTTSLAWEFDVLRKLEMRVRPHWKQQYPLPFPVEVSLILLADGAILGMKASSLSGFNLLSLANIYRRHGIVMPEILVLHYTSIMLHTLEVLHWHGKVLHCNIKPENWVMCSYDTLEVGESDHSGLMLVDFGDAIDLLQCQTIDSNPLNIKFSSDMPHETSACVAMREKIPWSFDVDTYGLCASVHLLLFGDKMEIEKKRYRWKLRHEFKRSAQRELWSSVFDNLLNIDEVTNTAIGSRPHSLRQLRFKIDEYLREEKDLLDNSFRKQNDILDVSSSIL